MRPQGRKNDALRELALHNATTRVKRPAACSCAWTHDRPVHLRVDKTCRRFCLAKGKVGGKRRNMACCPQHNTRKARDKAGQARWAIVEIQRPSGAVCARSSTSTSLAKAHSVGRLRRPEADGGTRTASINGAFVAVIDALATLKGEIAPLKEILRDSVAAISVGLLETSNCSIWNTSKTGMPRSHLNLVMTGAGQFFEVQGTG